MTNLPQLLTVARAAEYLDCSEITIRRMISRGDLKAVRIGRAGRMIRIPVESIGAAARDIVDVEDIDE